jgi:hypothetical protein
MLSLGSPETASANMLTLVVTLLSLLGFIVVFRRRRLFNVPLPPSPPSDFILGHLRHIPSENPEMQYAEWAKKYGEIFFASLSARAHRGIGDVIYLRVLNRDIIVLNSAKAAIDLLEKRGENYSERPRIVLFDM